MANRMGANDSRTIYGLVKEEPETRIGRVLQSPVTLYLAFGFAVLSEILFVGYLLFAAFSAGGGCQ